MGGVDVAVTMVRVVEQVGLQPVGENAAVAPVGSPAAKKETDGDCPDSRVAVMVLVTEEPWVTGGGSPLLEREKSEVALCARVGIRIKHRAVRNRFRIALLPFRATWRALRVCLSSVCAPDWMTKARYVGTGER